MYITLHADIVVSWDIVVISTCIIPAYLFTLYSIMMNSIAIDSDTPFPVEHLSAKFLTQVLRDLIVCCCI